MRLCFTKMQATGNDFIVVDRRDGGAPLAPDLVRRLCARHTGIGADGVLSVWPEAGVAARMQLQNADGSDSDMCGNGLRCVALFAELHGFVPFGQNPLRVAAGRGVYTIEPTAPSRYRVSMGAPRGDDASLPSWAASRAEHMVTPAAPDLVGLAVSFGNPHLVLHRIADPMGLARRFGSELEHHPEFPQRANVSFAQATSTGFHAVVHERGVGITQACGSGACAIGVTAVWQGLWPRGRAMEVALPGGVLSICVGDGDRVTMEGDAAVVFHGQFEPPVR